MKPVSAAIAAALAVATLAAPALAERVGWVRVTNPHDHAVTVEYRIGPFADCRKNNDFVGSRVVPAHDVWTLEVRSEGNACIRLAGSARWWHNKVTHGQTHQYTVE